MAGRAVTTEGLRKAIFEANPHLERGRDLRAVERLAMLYKLTDDTHAILEEGPSDTDTPVTVKAMLDEYHKLYADALRLEQELGITPAARQRQGLPGHTAPKAGGLGGAKS